MRIHSQIISTVSMIYFIIQYILEIVILLSLSIFPHLHIRHTKFIGYSGYSDNLAVKSMPPAISLYKI